MAQSVRQAYEESMELLQAYKWAFETCILVEYDVQGYDNPKYYDEEQLLKAYRTDKES